MSGLNILQVRDDLVHVANLLMAIQMMTEGPSLGRKEGATISEVVNVVLGSLSVADGRLEEMQGEAQP